MPQKIITPLTKAGTYPLTFSPTSTKFDIYNNSTYDIDITFGKTSGLSDIYLAPQASAMQVQPHSVQYSSGAVKWDGRVFIVATIPAGGTVWPGQGVAQQITIVGYETGYQAQNMFAMNNASQSTTIAGLVANSITANTVLPSVSAIAINLPPAGPLGFCIFLGYDVTSGIPSANVSALMSVTNLQSQAGNQTFVDLYSVYTTAPHDRILRIPGGVLAHNGSTSQFTIPQTTNMPQLGVILLCYVF